MDYPDADGKSTVIRIKKGLKEAIDDFLKTEKARKGGFDYKSDVANAAIRQLLQRYGVDVDHYYREEENASEHDPQTHQ